MNVKLRFLFACLTVMALGWLLRGHPSASFSQTESSAKPVDFDREVRPILSDTCFACHGPDEKQRMANLRLDETESLFNDRGGYKIIVPGDAAQSKLYQKISSKDPAVRMPPVFANRTLTDAQIELIRRWIDQGAKWETHWAWRAPKRPQLPQVKDKSWPRNPVDNFILARLEREGLTPSPEADKATLLRRVTLDLTGLPPTLAELDSFLADKSPDAYEKRVDQLLASPHYGERMTMPWLDIARYADTHGYHIDSLREMWRWRDWVIKAYNQNMPYDQFTIKQIAGDLLPNATVDDRIATGFNRNHMIDFEGGAIPQEYHVEYVVDRVSTTGTAWLGITIGCARCHDHKFDPIKQKDFYRFFAFFNTMPERGLDGITGNAAPVLELPSPEQERQRADLDAQIAKTLAAIPEKDMVALENEWRAKRLATMPAPPGEGLTAHYEFEGNLRDTSGHGLDAEAARGEVIYDDGQVGKSAEFSGETQVDFAAAGDFDRNKPFALAFWVQPDGTKPLDLIQKRDSSPNWRGYEISTDDPTFDGPQRPRFSLVIRLASRWPDDAIEVRTKEHIRFGGSRHLALNDDGTGRASGLSLYLDGKPVQLEAVKDHLTGSFRTDAPLSVGNNKTGKPFKGQLDDLRIYDRTLSAGEAENLGVELPARTLLAELQGKPVQEIAMLQPDKPPAEADIGMLDKAQSKEEKAANELKAHQARLSDYYLQNEAPESDCKLYAQLKDLREQRQKLIESIPTTMVMTEMAKPRDTFILGRGQYDNPQEKVTPGVPSFLPPLPAGAAPNRLTLARWIVDPGNPLTARVAVNRYWQEYFGIGLVKTSEDFGSQGEPPSNPELLDWLATEFIRTGWDVKRMQRLIVTSATYRQSSKAPRELVERDPENRLLARGPRFRLPAEEIRDSALAVSGLLSDKIGGPSVYPYQPKGIWEEMAFGEGFSAQSYTESTGADLYRRSMYTVWKRTVPPPALTTFDAPDREKCTARRTPTNTPLQALVLLNDPTYVEAARALAQRMMKEGDSSPVDRVDFAFRLATARLPSPAEREVLVGSYNEQLQDFRTHRDDAAKLVAVGASKYDSRLDPSELAAWTTVASMILNLDETITKE
jgi:Protein of unknown function (DUF1553)/Protein of unknown function (DUF1549)/Planctomycete cytochrome C/Concanavalin A-like lectin/glucanases superfamily